MTVKEALAQLQALGNVEMLEHNRKHGAGDNQFGVRLGDMRTLAKWIKTNHGLASALWKTEKIDERSLATLLIKPKDLAAERVVRSPEGLDRRG